MSDSMSCCLQLVGVVQQRPDSEAEGRPGGCYRLRPTAQVHPGSESRHRGRPGVMRGPYMGVFCL